METRSPEHFLALVDQKDAEIDQEIERLKNMKRFMEWERTTIKEALEAEVDKPKLAERGQEYLFSSEVKMCIRDRDIQKMSAASVLLLLVVALPVITKGLASRRGET